MTVVAVLLRPRGSPQWDAVVRGTGVIAALALYPTAHWPEVAGLVGFLAVTIVLNGPLAPLLPASYEPVLIVTGRVYPALVVALVGVAGTLYIEFLNYHLYRATLRHPRVRPAFRSALVRKTVALFTRHPFLCVWLCAWSPLPFWAVRFLAPLSGYPVAPFLWATFLGRLPRLWFFAALGAIVPLPTPFLVAFTAMMLAVAVAVAVLRGRHSFARLRRAADFDPVGLEPVVGRPAEAT